MPEHHDRYDKHSAHGIEALARSHKLNPDTESRMLNAHHHMPVPFTGRADAVEAATQADLDFLDLLTGPVNPSARARQQESCTDQSHPHPHVKTPMRRRDQLLDPLMISAVIEGSAPMATRNHFGHEFQGKSFLACFMVQLG